jgi:biotin synthase
MRIEASGDVFGAALDAPETFMTNGCPSADGDVACNRPFANERPSDRLRNYPFPPTAEDQRQILRQLRLEEMMTSL